MDENAICSVRNQRYTIVSTETYHFKYFAKNFLQLPAYPSFPCESMKMLCVQQIVISICDRIIIWVLKQNDRKVRLKVQYLVIWYLTEICFICINHICLKFRTRFLWISMNMIYTNEAEFRWGIKRQTTAPWVTLICHLVSTLKLLSSDWSQIMRDFNNELLSKHKIPIDLQHNYGIPGRFGKC